MAEVKSKFDLTPDNDDDDTDDFGEYNPTLFGKSSPSTKGKAKKKKRKKATLPPTRPKTATNAASGYNKPSPDTARG